MFERKTGTLGKEKGMKICDVGDDATCAVRYRVSGRKIGMEC